MIKLRIKDEWVFVSDTPACLKRHLNKIPQYQLLPNYRGVPRPEIFIRSLKKNGPNEVSFCSAGLWREVEQYLKRNGYEVERPLNDTIYTSFNLGIDEFRDYIKKWELDIEPREYQIKAAWLILKYKRSMSELATRSGKTLIGYIVFRTAMELLNVQKILMIVPSVQLVKQGLEDFKEYKEFFNGEEVWYKGEHVKGSNLTIGTYQSIVLRIDKKSKRYDPHFFDSYDMVLVDECHKLKAQSIQTILEQPFMKNVKIQFGFTGTLPKEDTIDWFCCQALMGPKIQNINTMDLVEEGYLVEPIIKQFRIKYNNYDDIFQECAEYLVSNYVYDENNKKIQNSKEDRKLFKLHIKKLPKPIETIKETVTKEAYLKYLLGNLKETSQVLRCEQLMTQRSSNRLELISKILSNTKGNFIVFAHNTEYINFLVSYFKTEFPNKNIYKIIGSDNLKKRQKVLDELLKSDNNILVGSYGCISTGITFKRIAGTILAQSFKSEIINIQSIGRLLLPEENKKEALVYDIIDVFDTKRIYNQGLQKIRDYNESNYKYEIDNSVVEFKDIFSEQVIKH